MVTKHNETSDVMKTCLDCKFADWRRNADGKLHRSGDGKCTYKVKMPVLPQAFYYISNPHISGGIISRKKDFDNNCAYYASTITYKAKENKND